MYLFTYVVYMYPSGIDVSLVWFIGLYIGNSMILENVEERFCCGDLGSHDFKGINKTHEKEINIIITENKEE